MYFMLFHVKSKILMKISRRSLIQFNLNFHHILFICSFNIIIVIYDFCNASFFSLCNLYNYYEN